MENVKVTVWLSTYNQEPYVAQALDSILMQKTDFPFEVIAADDCSTDRTQEIILDYQKRYPDKIVTFFPEHNLGGCRKLTGCVDAGLFRGEYLSYLEGDDYWLGEDRLQTLVDFLDEHPEYAAIAHQRDLVNEQGEAFGVDMPEFLLDKPFTIKEFLAGWDYPDFGSVFRNYYLQDGNKYHELLHASRNVCDFQDMFIMQDHGPVFVTSRVFGAYRCARPAGATNYNSITTQANRCMDHIRLCKAVESFYQGKYDLTPMIKREQGKLLRSICEKQDSNELHEAGPYLTKEAIKREMPQILYLALRGKRQKTVQFAMKAMSFSEKVSALLQLIPLSVQRIIEKISGKGHKEPSIIRGKIANSKENEAKP